jgi:hypothetical protein
MTTYDTTLGLYIAGQWLTGGGRGCHVEHQGVAAPSRWIRKFFYTTSTQVENDHFNCYNSRAC